MATRSKAGRSAYGAAVVRATEAFVPQGMRLFEDRLVLYFLPRLARTLVKRAWMRGPFLALMERAAPGIAGALLCRTRAIDDVVKAGIARGLRTVVILGAGLDTRPYRLTELRGAAVLEVDLPAVQEFKKTKLARRFGSLPKHVRFVPIDFNSQKLDAALAAGGLDAREPAIFIWEGVSQYLQPAGNPSRNTGALDAAWTIVTITGEDVSDVINQAAPTACIHVPRLDTSVAIQRARNTGLRNGAHGEATGATAIL